MYYERKHKNIKEFNSSLLLVITLCSYIFLLKHSVTANIIKQNVKKNVIITFNYYFRIFVQFFYYYSYLFSMIDSALVIKLSCLQVIMHN